MIITQFVAFHNMNTGEPTYINPDMVVSVERKATYDEHGDKIRFVQSIITLYGGKEVRVDMSPDKVIVKLREQGK